MVSNSPQLGIVYLEKNKGQDNQSVLAQNQVMSYHISMWIIKIISQILSLINLLHSAASLFAQIVCLQRGIQMVLGFEQSSVSSQGKKQGATVLLKMITPNKIILNFIPSRMDLPHPSSFSSTSLLAYFVCSVGSFSLFDGASNLTSSDFMSALTVSGLCSQTLWLQPAFKSGKAICGPSWASCSATCQFYMVLKASLMVSSGQKPPMVPCSAPSALQMPTKGKAVIAALAMQRSQWIEQSTEQKLKLHNFSSRSCSSTCLRRRQYLQFRVKNLMSLNFAGCWMAVSKLDQSKWFWRPCQYHSSALTAAMLASRIIAVIQRWFIIENILTLEIKDFFQQIAEEIREDQRKIAKINKLKNNLDYQMKVVRTILSKKEQIKKNLFSLLTEQIRLIVRGINSYEQYFMQVISRKSLLDFWQFGDIAQNLSISERPASFAYIVMNTGHFFLCLLGYSQQQIRVKLFLESANLLDNVLSQLDVIRIQFSDVDYLIKSGPAHSLLLALSNLIQNSIFCVVGKGVVYDFGIELFALVFIGAKTHDACKGDVKDDPVVGLRGFGIVHLKILFVEVKGSLFVDVDGAQYGIDILEVGVSSGCQANPTQKRIFEALLEQIPSLVH